MPALPQLYVNRPGAIAPIVLPGEVIGIWSGTTYNFYRVDYYDGVLGSNAITHDFGALVAQASTAITQLTLLEMPDHELGQFRAHAIDDIAAVLYQGRPSQMHALKNRTAEYTRFTAQQDPCGHLGEFFVHEHEYAFMMASNWTDYDITISRVMFWGFRFGLTSMPDYSWPTKVPAQWTRVPARAHVGK